MDYCGFLVRSKQNVNKGHKDCQGKLAFNTTGNEADKNNKIS